MAGEHEEDLRSHTEFVQLNCLVSILQLETGSSAVLLVLNQLDLRLCVEDSLRTKSCLLVAYSRFISSKSFVFTRRRMIVGASAGRRLFIQSSARSSCSLRILP